ncbi:MAG: FG-GAP-like repeat-containing protein, partial [Chitinophagaceae bacterium]
MDLIVSNINEKPHLYRNRIETQKTSANYLNISLKGAKSNPNALGANISIWYGNAIQTYRYSPYRGYLSTYQLIAHFGLGSVTSVDSVRVDWPDGFSQTMTNIKANQDLVITQLNNDQKIHLAQWEQKSIFREITNKSGITYRHKEFDFVDFNIQRLLPHKLSEYGPAIAAGDINGDGLDDLVCGGSLGYMAQLFFQQPDGTFSRENLFGNTDSLPTKTSEDQGLLLFDADGDRDLDLYIASGGYESKAGSLNYQDRLYINQGNGKFLPDSQALPQNFVSKSCVKASDVDRDGDLDLFVGGRVEPGKYPSPVQSFLFRNDSKNGLIRFTDVTAQIASELMKAGMICDAIFTDINNDDWPDLVLAGEWMPIVILQNEKGKFRSIAGSDALKKTSGWWNSIAAGDVDNDGDIDYIAGN